LNGRDCGFDRGKPSRHNNQYLQIDMLKLADLRRSRRIEPALINHLPVAKTLRRPVAGFAVSARS
jgi:hypothetical protein